MFPSIIPTLLPIEVRWVKVTSNENVQRNSCEWFENVAFAAENQNLHYLFIEEYFFVRTFILLFKVWTCHMELDLPVLLGAGMFVG